MTDIHDDVLLAQRYISKSVNAKDRGIDFELSFSEYKRLKNIKRCQYSGLPFRDNHGPSAKGSFSKRTIERIDNSIGYTKENCVAVCAWFNDLKGVWENSTNPLTEKMLMRAIQTMGKLRKSRSKSLSKGYPFIANDDKDKEKVLRYLVEDEIDKAARKVVG